jgi:endonuclease YncB( thermonuclease family)
MTPPFSSNDLSSRRRDGHAGATALALAVVSLLGLIGGLALGQSGFPPSPFAKFPPNHGAYRVLILRHVDADTVVVGHVVEEKVRLWGIEAPEIKTREGQAALAWLKAALPQGQLANCQLFGRADGRQLADLQDVSGYWLSKSMVEAGHAEKWNGKGPRP